MNLTRYACFGVLMVLILTGCQATPNQDVIANKNDQQVSQSESGTSIEESNSVEEVMMMGLLCRKQFLKRFLLMMGM